MPRRVTFTVKRGRDLDPHERVSGIGGDGWQASEEEAIATLKADLNAYYLETLDGTAYLIVGLHRGREYLTIEADGIVPRGLLELPDGP